MRRVSPRSCLVANKDELGVVILGSHDSKPSPCAGSIADLDVIIDENIPKQEHELGEYILNKLEKFIIQLLKMFAVKVCLSVLY